MGKEITILQGSTGINNVVDPARLKFSKETGLSELKAAVNVEIDETGRINRRRSTVLLQALPGAHSLFSYKNDCFVAAAGALYRVNADYTLLGLRSGMHQTAKLSYTGVGDKIFYTNGHEQGYIGLQGVSYPWTKSEYEGPLDTRKYYDPPLGQVLMVAHGRMYLAEDYVVWYSEPFAYSLFRMAKSYHQFGSRVNMLVPVDDGFYVGDQEGVYFVDLEQNKKQVCSSQAFEGSEITLPEGVMPKLEMGGSIAFWTTPNGVWVGSSAGQAINLTENKLVFPDGHTQGSTVLRDDGFIITLMM